MNFTNEQINDLFNSLAENSAIIIFNTKREIVYASSEFAETLGYRVDELIGLRHSDLCFAEFTESPAYKVFWQNLLSGKSYQDKIVRRAKSGAEVVLEAKYFPIRNANDEIIGIGKICFNKTDQDNKLNEVLSNNFKKLADISDKLTSLSGNGTNKLSELSDVMTSVIGSSENNITSTEKLKERTSEIENITDTVHEIAYQTNMLAVNAALESTRAGSEGQGFSVVAQEMRKLASQVDDASRNIQKTVGDIIDEVQNIISSSKKTGSTIADAQNVLSENQKSFDELIEHAHLMTTTIRDLDQVFKVDRSMKVED